MATRQPRTKVLANVILGKKLFVVFDRCEHWNHPDFGTFNCEVDLPEYWGIPTRKIEKGWVVF